MTWHWALSSGSYPTDTLKEIKPVNPRLGEDIATGAYFWIRLKQLYIVEASKCKAGFIAFTHPLLWTAFLYFQTATWTKRELIPRQGFCSSTARQSKAKGPNISLNHYFYFRSMGWTSIWTCISLNCFPALGDLPHVPQESYFNVTPPGKLPSNNILCLAAPPGWTVQTRYWCSNLMQSRAIKGKAVNHFGCNSLSVHLAIFMFSKTSNKQNCI